MIPFPNVGIPMRQRNVVRRGVHEEISTMTSIVAMDAVSLGVRHETYIAIQRWIT